MKTVLIEGDNPLSEDCESKEIDNIFHAFWNMW